MATDFTQLITEIASSYRLRPALVIGQVEHESGGNPFAIGDGGLALGLLQVHPGACKDVGADWSALHAAIDAGDETKAAAMGLHAGCAYLAKMMKLMGGDEAWALACYNQGPTMILKAKLYAEAVARLEPR